MEQKHADDEASLLHSRREDFLLLTEARQAEEQRRRESLVGRGVAACQQREAAQRMEQERWEAETDALMYRHYLRNQQAEGAADEARRKRESLAGRLDEWRAQRSAQEALREAHDQDERGLLESKRANWVDANEHKHALDQKRRESLAFRLDEWRAQKQVGRRTRLPAASLSLNSLSPTSLSLPHLCQVAERENNERAEAERIEWELRQQEAEDVATYRQACDRSRRESLAARLDKARKDRTVEEALREQQAIIEAEELRLRAEDHAAVAQYHKDCDAARRQSLAFRNRMAVSRMVVLVRRCRLTFCPPPCPRLPPPGGSIWSASRSRSVATSSAPSRTSSTRSAWPAGATRAPPTRRPRPKPAASSRRSWWRTASTTSTTCSGTRPRWTRCTTSCRYPPTPSST